MNVYEKGRTEGECVREREIERFMYDCATLKYEPG